VKTVYERLLTDLNLKAEDVPLFAGEVVGAEVGGTCALHNTIIAQLPEVIPTAHVIHSTNCAPASDIIHFTVASYRTMGKRYAYEALRQMGLPTQAQVDFKWNDTQKKFYSLKSLDSISDIELNVGGNKTLRIIGLFNDGHRENLTRECVITSSDFQLDGSTINATEAKKGTITVSFTDFLGQEFTQNIQVICSATGPNHVLVLGNPAASTNTWDYEAIVKLATPMQKGKNYIIRATMRGDQANEFALWPRYDASTNRDEWGNSADIQYLSPCKLTTSFQEFTWLFSADYPHDVLIFAIGKLGGNVYIDDLSCKEADGTTEMMANGSFESDDISNWSVLGWTNQTMSVEEDNTTSIRLFSTGLASDDSLYDLQGRRLQKKPAKGIYLFKNKKHISR